MVGHEIASGMAYLGESFDIAARKVVMEDFAPYYTGGMFRGWVKDGRFSVGSHAEMYEYLPPA